MAGLIVYVQLVRAGRAVQISRERERHGRLEPACTSRGYGAASHLSGAARELLGHERLALGVWRLAELN